MTSLDPGNAPVAGGIAGQFTVGKGFTVFTEDDYTVLFENCINTGELTSRGADQPGYCDPMLGQISNGNNTSQFRIVLKDCKDGENVIATAPSSLAAESGQAIRFASAGNVYLKITSGNSTSLFIVRGENGTEKNWEAVSE